jgi:hypothetical protein
MERVSAKHAIAVLKKPRKSKALGFGGACTMGAVV